MKTLDLVSGGLLILAGLNCGVVAVLQRDLLTENSPIAMLPRLFFVLVGVAALYRLMAAFTQPEKSATGRTQVY